MDYFWIGLALAALLVFARERVKRNALQVDLDLLAVKREAMRRALEYMNDGALLLGKQGRVLYANPAALHLLGAEHRPGISGPARSGVSGQSRPGRKKGEPTFSIAEDCALGQIVRNPVLLAAMKNQVSGTTRRIVQVETADGEPLALDLTQAPAGPDCWLFILRDTRDSAEVSRKRRDFVANASHELKTPIAALVGMLDLVDMVSEAKRKELLDRCRHNANSLAGMAEDLLGLARAEDPDWRPTPQPTDIVALLESAVAEVGEKAAKKGLELKLELDQQSLNLLVDADALQTVVRNLLVNAVNYTAQGEVVLRASQADGLGAILEISDTGPGMDPEILPRIFERFFRGDPAHSRATGGTGLGLSIVRNLVNQMGGRIAVSSETGVGSSFRVELPANPTRPLSGATSPRK